MKIITNISHLKDNFRVIESNNDFFKFQDIRCPVRIQSQIPNPFDSKACVLISTNSKRTDNSIYLSGITFKIFLVSEINHKTKEGFIIFEKYKADFPYNLFDIKAQKTGVCLCTFHFPIGGKFWVNYQVWQKFDTK
jgi:hypothetical protein